MTSADNSRRRPSGRRFFKLKVQSLKLKPPISFVNKQFMQKILTVSPKTLPLSQMLNSGYRLAVRDNVYLLNLLPIDPHLESSIYLMFVHNISEVPLAHKQYQTQVLVISITVVVLCIIALFLMTWQFRRRLLIVAEQLPLLAQKKYQEFRTRKFTKGRFSSMRLNYCKILQLCSVKSWSY